MKTLLFSFLLFASGAFAQSGHEVLKAVGKLYDRTEGNCPSALDIMPWFNYETEGTISFALTDRPGIRPLEGYWLSATISAKRLAPLGSGIFSQEFNQPVPMKAEFSYQNEALVLNLHHKGKGSPGGIFTGEPGYAKQNHKLDYVFTEKNADGLYEKLKLTYTDLKPIRSKKMTCNFELNH